MLGSRSITGSPMKGVSGKVSASQRPQFRALLDKIRDR